MAAKTAVSERSPPLAPDRITSSAPPPKDNNTMCSTHGTREMDDLVSIFEDHGIFCFLVGVSALIFYGAGRLRHEWELCVASEQLEEAIGLLGSDEMLTHYVPVLKSPLPQPGSLAHTYSRYSGKAGSFQFVLVPSEDAHIRCDRSTVWRSQNNLPYPSLPEFVQSLIDTNDEVALCDVIDGADLTEEWGNEMLDLEGTTDVNWAEQMNQRMDYSMRDSGTPNVCRFPNALISRREVWEKRVRNKSARMGWTQPKELFITRFRLRDSADPWKEYSSAS